MADTPKGGSHTIKDFLFDGFRELFVTHGLPMMVKLANRASETRLAEREGRKRNKHYFAAAMVKLRLRDGRAADVIGDFVDHWLNTDADREDFQHNAACVGTDKDEKMGDTVEFLWQLAHLPDHAAREVHLTALGFIGARSVDMAEKAVELLKRVRDEVKDLPADAKKKLNEGTKALRELNNKQWMQNAEKSSAAFRQTAATRLTGYRARRRS
ncbi:MAG: hypothetical protein A3B10_02790 [Candidatus Doudnabacteria bacterium RIFCSPLOWO2_01_FULL_44_21]|uniref:Uncharacterized protein n=1 Tax=Candidatus Doudnabacteria bacterium RIFCSPLOWO2_01_FULL_44_21 TaxID=1817841 RepID=A0A1F5Q264_9BACT|nr:MAG: hypothetical protein A3B95_03060 [Candidatus Doudnabacteria bacterium RIFCSPHIGHO2_02_FULL_43_13b]OGE96214.1 MAG: hypothetical protein A3B10_02790 [Candidatus Doudnabacteria bacterium RIFCSPLOWO2_01_FULL_44_21]